MNDARLAVALEAAEVVEHGGREEYVGVEGHPLGGRQLGGHQEVPLGVGQPPGGVPHVLAGEGVEVPPPLRVQRDARGRGLAPGVRRHQAGGEQGGA